MQSVGQLKKRGSLGATWSLITMCKKNCVSRENNRELEKNDRKKLNKNEDEFSMFVT